MPFLDCKIGRSIGSGVALSRLSFPVPRYYSTTGANARSIGNPLAVPHGHGATVTKKQPRLKTFSVYRWVRLIILPTIFFAKF